METSQNSGPKMVNTNPQIPTVGRMVNYHPTDEEKEKMAALTNCNSQDVLPAVIVATWGKENHSAFNAKVMLDGDQPDLWKTSIHLYDLDENGNGVKGNCSWPVINRTANLAG